MAHDPALRGDEAQERFPTQRLRHIDNPAARRIRIDPTQGQPRVVGSTWTLREPDDSDPYSTVNVVGIVILNEVGEVAIQPAGFGAVVSMDVTAFQERYRRIDIDVEDKVASLEAAVARLQAQVGA